jgi:ABC-type dipeptide/oligopeptide/nickel transport system permease subunit
VNEAKFTLRIGWRQVLAQMSFGVLIAALTLLDALAIEQLIEGRADAWMVLPALLSAVLVVMLARANGSWLAVPKAWIAGMLAGLARPFIRIELVGIETSGGAREIVAIMRIGRFRRTQWRIPAGAVRSVRWEPIRVRRARSRARNGSCCSTCARMCRLNSRSSSKHHDD